MPKTYKPEDLALLKNQILDRLWLGYSLIKTLKEINEGEITVSRQTVYEWLNPKSEYYDKAFSDDYVRTREIQGDYNAEKVEDLAAAVEAKELPPDIGRVAMDGQKWAAGVKQPKKYGNKSFVEQKTTTTIRQEYFDLSCLSKDEFKEYERLVRKIYEANGIDPDEDPK